jgi:hypothetical protein
MLDTHTRMVGRGVNMRAVSIGAPQHPGTASVESYYPEAAGDGNVGLKNRGSSAKSSRTDVCNRTRVGTGGPYPPEATSMRSGQGAVGIRPSLAR